MLRLMLVLAIPSLIIAQGIRVSKPSRCFKKFDTESYALIYNDQLSFAKTERKLYTTDKPKNPLKGVMHQKKAVQKEPRRNVDMSA